jgi:hypothetical protein
VGREPGSGPAQLTCPNTDTDQGDQGVPVLFAPLFLEGPYHNKRFVALATEMGLRDPDRPEKVIGWSDCRITDDTAAAYVGVISAIDSARLPFLPDSPFGTGGGEDGQGGERTARTKTSRRSAAAAASPSSAPASRPASCT